MIFVVPSIHTTHTVSGEAFEDTAMSMQSVELLYGRGTLTLSLPEDAQATVISKPEFPACASAVEVF